MKCCRIFLEFKMTMMVMSVAISDDYLAVLCFDNNIVKVTNTKKDSTSGS